MTSDTQKTEIDNLRVQSQAKEKVLEVVDAVKAKMGVKPTLSEAIILASNHYLDHLGESKAA